MIFPTFAPHPQSLGKRQALLLMLSVLGCTLLVSNPAQALYKIIEADGKVTYTDHPPTQSNTGQAVSIGTTPKALPNPSIANLPFDLKQAVSEFPVILYTLKSECPPCDQGRHLLKQRGVPFRERLIISKADLDALKDLTGSQDTPVIVIGKQVNRGFSTEVWNQYLDFAGYPKTSKLPATYSFAAPEPLTQQQNAEERIEERSALPAKHSAPPPQAGTRASRIAEKNATSSSPHSPVKDPNAIQF